MRKKLETYIVRLKRPDGISVRDMKYYIKEALNAWNGQFEPPNEDNLYTGDPLWNFEISSVRKLKL